MTMKTKQELITQITALLNEVIEVEEQAAESIPQSAKPLELLTIKECSEAVKGLSEHTIRQLVAQEKSRTYGQVRASAGKSLSVERRYLSIWEVRRDEFLKLV